MEKLVLTVGMHRSGTSLVTGILNSLGVDMLGGGKYTILPSDVGNSKGYFELLEMNEVNDLLLDESGGCWWNPPTLSALLNKTSWYAVHRGKDLFYGLRHARTSDMWGWKDPRMCVTLPWWRTHLLDNLNVPKYLIYVHRSKEAICRSICVRDNQAQELADPEVVNQLIDQYIVRLETELSTLGVGYNVLNVQYTDLLAYPGREISLICDFLGEVFSEAKVSEALEIVCPELNHSGVIPT